MKVFNKYAEYYNLLYSEKNYSAESEYIDELIKKYSIGSKSILDLGCGTGAHDFHLSEKGYNVDGVDISESMVSIAKQQLSDMPISKRDKLSFSVGDIRKFRNGVKYDVVVSLFHVMSYQTSNEDLMAAFVTASKHLKPGGIFIFDYWYGPGVLTDPPVVRVKEIQNDKVSVIRLSVPTILPNENCVDVKFKIIVKDLQSNDVDFFDETHSMRYFFKPEILDLKGFNFLGQYEWLKIHSCNKATWNAVSIIQNEI